MFSAYQSNCKLVPPATLDTMCRLRATRKQCKHYQPPPKELLYLHCLEKDKHVYIYINNSSYNEHKELEL